MLDATTFAEFPLWEGIVPGGHTADFLGHLIPARFFAGGAPSSAYHAITNYPQPDEEIFEWLALLQAVLSARDTFTMIEAGAGYGRWTARAACAIRQRRLDVAPRLIAVEAEPTHYVFLGEHLRANSIDPTLVTTIMAALNPTGEPVPFTVGSATEWYGQQIAAGQHAAKYNLRHLWRRRIKTVPGVSLQQLLTPLDRVDFIDMDVQGTEADCIRAAIEPLSTKARALSISTHSGAIHEDICDCLAAHGWILQASYLPAMRQDTQFGLIDFQDGIICARRSDPDESVGDGDHLHDGARVA